MSTSITPKRPAPVAKTAAANPFLAVREELNELLSKFWNGNREGWLAPAFEPAADLVEKPNAFEVRMDIPGMESKNIDVQVEGNVVSISGKREEEKEEKTDTFHRVERTSGSFFRTLTLPAKVNADEVAAHYDKGVLTVTLPKSEEAAGKKIKVQG